MEVCENECQISREFWLHRWNSENFMCDTKFFFECWNIFYTANEWNIFSTWKEKFRISKRPYNVLFIIINTNEIPNHFTLIVFWCEMCDLLCSHSNGDIIFSHAKITCYFHMWRYQLFMRKLTWYFIGVYIIKMTS